MARFLSVLAILHMLVSAAWDLSSRAAWRTVTSEGQPATGTIVESRPSYMYRWYRGHWPAKSVTISMMVESRGPFQRTFLAARSAGEFPRGALIAVRYPRGEPEKFVPVQFAPLVVTAPSYVATGVFGLVLLWLTRRPRRSDTGA